MRSTASCILSQIASAQGDEEDEEEIGAGVGEEKEAESEVDGGEGEVARMGDRREVMKKRSAANSARCSSRASSQVASASRSLGLISIIILNSIVKIIKMK